MATKEIIQELSELNSNLEAGAAGNIFSVPSGYFENFPANMLALTRIDDKDLNWLNELPNVNPYTLPAGYFDGLEERIMNLIRENADYQTSAEEIAAISPLLSSINKKPVFTVPEGYFSNLQIETKPKQSKLVSFTKHRRFRLAVAAMITGVIAIGALFVFNSQPSVSVNDAHAWVAKSMKKVSTQEISDFVKLAEQGNSIKENVAINNKQGEVKELVKDIPVNEIDQFLNETGSDEESTTDAMMN